MTPRRSRGRLALIVGLAVTGMFVIAQRATAAVPDPDRRLAHPVLLGAGATWTESGRFRHTVYPGAMFELDLGLGRFVALGAHADFTYIDERPHGPQPVSTNHRMIAGLDFKLLPPASAKVCPYVMVSAAGSVVHDTGYGYGFGAGAVFLTNTRAMLFVDLRRYYFADMENPSFEQAMLRAGVGF